MHRLQNGSSKYGNGKSKEKSVDKLCARMGITKEATVSEDSFTTAIVSV